MTKKQIPIALSLLRYLQTKYTESTFTDDYYNYLKELKYTEIEIELVIDILVNDGYIKYLGVDQYWIQLTEKGEKYAKNKGKEPSRINWKLIIEIIVAVLGLIAALASF